MVAQLVMHPTMGEKMPLPFSPDLSTARQVPSLSCDGKLSHRTLSVGGPGLFQPRGQSHAPCPRGCHSAHCQPPWGQWHTESLSSADAGGQLPAPCVARGGTLAPERAD